MPILFVKALPQHTTDAVGQAIRAATSAIATECGCPLDHVWVTWEEISAGFYFEGHTSQNRQPLKTHPPICELVCFEGADQAKIERMLVQLSRAMESALHLEANIFISYRELKAGQVIAGNGAIRR
jgi:phenylpyruvate tautomerase PptA (4-oxalocrotonate tautomerase family)